MKTDEELKQLAKDVFSDKVFTDRHIPNGDSTSIAMIFMPLALMDEDAVKALEKKNPVMIYEYMDKAGPRGINGHPNFFSFQFLTEEEMPRFIEYFGKIKEALESV